jgi:hypothetical protein
MECERNTKAELWRATEVASVEDVLTSGLEEMGMDGARAIDALFGESSIVDSPLPDRKFLRDAGYILPNGDFYVCKYMEHSELAATLLKHLYSLEVKDPQIEADNRNWLRIQPSALEPGKYAIMSPKNRPTQAQERTLVDWCLKWQVPYPADLKEED